MNTLSWEQRRLGDICYFFRGQGYSKADLVRDGYPVILYGTMYTDYKIIIDEINTFVQNDNGKFHTIGGEIIIPASGETPEEISRASVVDIPGIIVGGDLHVIRVKKNIIHSVYLALLLTYSKLKIELYKKAQGKSVVHLHSEDIKSLDIFHPNYTEQSLIGEFFRRLDDRITHHQRKPRKISLSIS